ncbi:MAG: type II toxin-antitoxin system VapC family toxin [Gemmatimonadetes bacterium]|nr:type II toxin-antitoxin system VapC family toxin [Gemmatimonadota bacterium]
MTSALFWDASALVKAYILEDGTPNVRSAMALREPQGFATDFVALEVLASLAKKRRTGAITGARYRDAVAEFKFDYSRKFNVVQVEANVRTEAMRFAEKYYRNSIGSMDLLHLACACQAALLCRPFPLVVMSADQPLLEAARAETLATYNPEVQPHAAVRTALRIRS